MEVLEKISLWGGIAGVFVAIFAVIILYLTRSNIVNILDKDIIMYDKNFEMKKSSFQNACDILDFYETYGFEIRTSKQFIAKAKTAYNDLMIVSDNQKIYEEFHRLTLDSSTRQVTPLDIHNFKVMCRTDMNLKTKKMNKKELEQFSALTLGGPKSLPNSNPNDRR